MPIKIAFISSKAYKKYISSIAQNIEDSQFDFYVYNSPETAVNLLPQVKPCDILIIGGLLPYNFIKPAISSLPYPVTYIAQDESAVATTLLSALATSNIAIDELSIDVIEENFVATILADIDYAGRAPYILCATAQDLYSQHVALYEAGKVKLMITSAHQVFEQLRENGYPAFRMKDSKLATLQKLEKIKAAALLRKSELNRAAAGIMTCQNEDFEHFIELTKEMQASYQKNAQQEYEIYVTAGRLQAFLQSPNLASILSRFKASYAIGFGQGETIIEALQQAKEAWKFAKPNEVFLLDEHSTLAGPYPKQNRLLALKLADPLLLEISHKTKLRALTLAKFMNFLEERQSAHFTAQHVADYLHLSRRTAERTIKKLVDHHYVDVVSSEMTYAKGRPRAVYSWRY